jgi:mycofactocin precursor
VGLVAEPGAPHKLGSPGARIVWALACEEVVMLREGQDATVAEEGDELSDEDVDELLVEEVSIDGMCGVY